MLQSGGVWVLAKNMAKHEKVEMMVGLEIHEITKQTNPNEPIALEPFIKEKERKNINELWWS